MFMDHTPELGGHSAPTAASASGTMLPTPWRIETVHRETSDTFTLTLAPAAGVAAVRFAPGQFNMLYVFGVGEVPISISGDPAEVSALTHTTRAVGTVTQAMRRLAPGAALGVRGPFGVSWPMEFAKGRDVLLVAGGLGLAPLRPALYHLLAHRADYGRVALLCGTRTPRDFLYRRELRHWGTRRDLEVHLTVDRAVGRWRGNVGVVTKLIPRAPFDPSKTVAMVTGPEVMMRFTALELQRRGVPPERIFLSLERNMQCAVGFCGHCQYGPSFVCKDGPVFRYDRVKSLFSIREI